MNKHHRLLGFGAAGILAFSGALLLGQSTGTAPAGGPFDRLHFRSIGPTAMSGRITDLAVYEANPAIYYVGTAHGGVWKTTSNGATYEALFQDSGLMGVGDLAISQKNPDLVWMGSGEGNNRQSISWGSGIYKSTDGGKSFKLMGLADSKHINRILIDPNNDNVVLAAAQGPLFGPGGDRGVFKTTDGGATWKQVLKVDADTGANDIAMSLADPKVIYASTYQRRRVQCCMNGGGPGSGIWKSTDGGDTWTRQTAGLPAGPMGRIGLDVYRRSANIAYASIEGEGPAGGGRGAAPDSGLYRTDDGGASWRKVSSANPRPMYFSQVRIDPSNPDRVYMGGVGMQMTNDAGKTMETDAAQATHDDVHAIWINPANTDHLITGNDGGVYSSYDMSKTWVFHPNIPVGLFYHVGFDLEYPYNVCGGMQDNYDWCGPSTSRFSAGIRQDEWFTIQGGDGFVAIVDQRNSRIVYTESQDGNLTRKDKLLGESKSIRPTLQNVTNATAGEAYRFHWDTPLMFSPNDSGTLLVGANRVFKSTDRGDSWTAISPDLTANAVRNDIVTMGLKGSDIRISKDDGISAWPTIVALAESPKMAGVYYTGTDDGTVSMSKDAGKTWDKTLADRLPGFVKGAFISEVVPSKYDAGTVYITSDAHRLNDYDTHIWVSHDFGATFASLNGNLKGEAVKTLTEDPKNADVLYIGTETGIFLSIDRGKSWQRLKANLPTVRVDEITIHPRDNAMLVATHGRNLWILDHLEPIQEHAAAQSAMGDAKLFSIGPALQWKTKDDRNNEFWGHQYFLGENPPTDAVINFNLKKPATGEMKLKITDALGKDVREVVIPAAKNQAGIQTVCWDMRVQPIPAAPGGAAGAPGRGAGGGQAGAGRGAARAVAGVPAPPPVAGYLPMNPCGGGGGRGGGGFGGGGLAPQVLPGTYNVALVIDGKAVETKPMKVIGDPGVQMNDVQRKRLYDISMDLHELQRRGTEMTLALQSLYTQLDTNKAKLDAAPADVKTALTSFNKDFDAVRPKFGVPPPAPVAGGGRGGGRGGAPPDPNNVAAKAGAVKTQVMAFSDLPSDTLMKQYADVKLTLPKAIAEGNAVLAKATPLAATLKKADVTLTVPATVK